MTPSWLRPLAAEAIGTFALVFAGTGAVVVDATTGGAVSHVGIGLPFGLVIMVMIYALGHISGAHFNSAVTAGFAVGRHFPWPLVPRYWAAQLAGGVAASLQAWYCAPCLATRRIWAQRCPAVRRGNPLSSKRC